MSKESSEFWNGPTGKGIAIGGAVILLGILVWKLLPSNPAAEASSRRVFIDADTNKPFNTTLEAGMMIPIKAPSGKNTGYPAELCYWNKDGSTRKEAFPVLLKKAVDPAAGPTFCPDCGRLVVGHNPAPTDGKGPPPTEEEYAARRGNRDTASENRDR